ncbi:hypothetical protein AB3S75_017038 [Citrus x aurantiifolia]
MTDQSTLWGCMSSWLTLTPSTLFLFVNLVIGTIAVTSRFTSANRNPQQTLTRAPSLLHRVKSIDFSLYRFPTQPEQQQQEEEPHYFHQPTEEPPTYPVEPAPEQTHQLVRAPSLLDRVKSINFSLYKFPSYPAQEPEPEPEPYSYANPVEPEPGQLDRAPSLLERVKSIRFPSVYRSQEAETEVIGGNHEAETNTVHKPKRSKSESTNKAKTKSKENMKKSASEKAMAVEEEREMVERRRPQTARLERTVTVGDGDHAVDARADDFINKFKRQLRLQRLDSLLRYKEVLQGK